LAKAFRGELTERDPRDEPASNLLERIQAERRKKWEAEKGGKGKKYFEAEPLDTSQLPELPDRWVWTTWEMILANEEGAFRRGPFGSNLTKSIFVESGYKVYEQYCAINDDCSFGRYYITPEKFEEMISFAVKAGDYLMSCSGVTLGRITRVPQEFDPGIINQALLRIRINEHAMNGDFFLRLFRSPHFQKSLLDNSTGSAIPNVKGVKELKAIPVPLAPIAEQRRIVAKIESLSAQAEAIERAVEIARRRAEKVDQAVLARAFRGELLLKRMEVESEKIPDV